MELEGLKKDSVHKSRASKVERCYVEPFLIRQSLRFTQVLTSETQFDFSSFGDRSEVSQTF